MKKIRNLPKRRRDPLHKELEEELRKELEKTLIDNYL